jgi:hypothetical protein
MIENEIKSKVPERRFHDDDTSESMKKYYGIDDHRDLKYIRLNGLENQEHYDSNDANIKSQQSHLKSNYIKYNMFF